MKIVVKNETNLVIGYGNISFEGEFMFCNGARYQFLTPENTTVVEAKLPTPWIAGGYNYVGGKFTLNAMGQKEVDRIADELATQSRLLDRRAKGWNDPWDLIDDILARGVGAVKIDRDQIKSNHPKATKS